MSFRTSPQTGVGISIEFQAAHRHTVRSNLPCYGVHPREMVRLTRRLPRQCALLYRNDREFDKFQFAYNRTIPSGSGKKRLQTNPVTTCLRGTRRYRAGQGKNDYRPRSSRLACGAPADTERVREKTITDQGRHDLPAGHPPIPSGSGKERLQTNPVTTCLRGTRRHRAGQA